jgi:hypothetical protein
MQQTTENEVIILQLGDGALSVPKESLMLAWLNQVLLTAPATTPHHSVPRIGAEWPGEGGVYAGIMRGENGKPDYHVIVPTCEDAFVKEITFGPAKDVPSASSEYDGRANTIALVNEGGHPAADWAHGLDIGPHSDFYLPARHELRLAWLNVPELFEKAWHWSSTQFAATPASAWTQNFGNGFQGDTLKSSSGRARAFRRLIIQ